MAVGVGPLSQMAASTVQRGAITCSGAPSVCGKAGYLQLAKILCAGTAESAVQQNADRCSAAIIACREGGGWPSALGLRASWLRPHSRVGASRRDIEQTCMYSTYRWRLIAITRAPEGAFIG